MTGPVVRVLGVQVALTKTSYAPGEPTDLRIASDSASLEVQVFHYAGPERFVERDLRTNGVAVTPPAKVDWRAHREAPSHLRFLRAGEWRSGLYFVRARGDDGNVGYAPFIVRPRTLGEHRVAVVLSTNTWQAYNFHDADGDGWGDSWYVSSSTRSVDVSRPFLDFGVPFRFRDWDLAFIAWLNRTGKQVDFLSDDDVESAGTGDQLRRAYDLVVFPGHAEYVTTRGLDVIERYRALGGNLLFLSANNFFCRVRRDGTKLVREQLWRDVGRPEVGARRRAVRRLRLRAAPGPVRRPRRRRRGLGVRGDGARERLVLRPLRDRARRAHCGLASGHDAARGDQGPDGPRPLGRDDVLRDAGRCEGLRRGRAELRRVDRRPAGLAARRQRVGAAKPLDVMAARDGAPRLRARSRSPLLRSAG